MHTMPRFQRVKPFPHMSSILGGTVQAAPPNSHLPKQHWPECPTFSSIPFATLNILPSNGHTVLLPCYCKLLKTSNTISSFTASMPTSCPPLWGHGTDQGLNKSRADLAVAP